EAATDVEDVLSTGRARHLGDQIRVRIERLPECLGSGAEIPEMEAVSVEQASLVRDQVEVRGNAAGRPPPSEENRHRHPGRGAQLSCARGGPLLLPGSYEDSGRHRLGSLHI